MSNIKNNWNVESFRDALMDNGTAYEKVNHLSETMMFAFNVPYFIKDSLVSKNVKSIDVLLDRIATKIARHLLEGVAIPSTDKFLMHYEAHFKIAQKQHNPSEVLPFTLFLSDGQVITALVKNTNSNGGSFAGKEEVEVVKWAINNKDITEYIYIDNNRDIDSSVMAKRLAKIANVTHRKFISNHPDIGLNQKAKEEIDERVLNFNNIVWEAVDKKDEQHKKKITPGVERSEFDNLKIFLKNLGLESELEDDDTLDVKADIQGVSVKIKKANEYNMKGYTLKIDDEHGIVLSEFGKSPYPLAKKADNEITRIRAIRVKKSAISGLMTINEELEAEVQPNGEISYKLGDKKGVAQTIVELERVSNEYLNASKPMLSDEVNKALSEFNWIKDDNTNNYTKNSTTVNVTVDEEHQEIFYMFTNQNRDISVDASRGVAKSTFDFMSVANKILMINNHSDQVVEILRNNSFDIEKDNGKEIIGRFGNDILLSFTLGENSISTTISRGKGRKNLSLSMEYGSKEDMNRFENFIESTINNIEKDKKALELTEEFSDDGYTVKYDNGNYEIFDADGEEIFSDKYFDITKEKLSSLTSHAGEKARAREIDFSSLDGVTDREEFQAKLIQIRSEIMEQNKVIEYQSEIMKYTQKLFELTEAEPM